MPFFIKLVNIIEDIKISDELMRLIPPLTADELAQLESNILSDGIRDSLLVARYPDPVTKKLVEFLADGHNRLRIAEVHKLDYKVCVKDFDTKSDVIIWMIDNQNGRRNLSDFVRYELAQVKAEALREKGQDRRVKTLMRGNVIPVLSITDKTEKYNSRKEIAADLGWSTGKLAQADVVNKHADEETKELLRKGEISINKAYVSIKQNDKPHVSKNSGENEWYTPAKYIEAARSVMGCIDLDPATSEVANEVVKAESIFTIVENGLNHKWFGNVWLNPPYGQPEIGLFCEKLVDEINEFNVEQSIVLVNNATETKWGQSLLSIANALCFPKGRIKYWYPGRNNNTPLQGQMFIYIGNHPSKFCHLFTEFGVTINCNG